jgi:hypothetical protein
MESITITTPFAGKQYCFAEYTESVGSLIAKHGNDFIFNFVVYDNSNDDDFRYKLRSWLRGLPENVKLIYHVDTTPPSLAENTRDYLKTNVRVAQIYYKIFQQLVPPCDYVLNIEDDISWEGDYFAKAWDAFKHDPEIATVGGVSVGRKLEDNCVMQHVWGFNLNNSFPPVTRLNRKPGVFEIPPKPFGVEVVGAVALGFWLTKYPVLKELGWSGGEVDGPFGGDINWGYQLMKGRKGYVVVDWSLRLKHWWLFDGKKDYFTVGKGGTLPPNASIKGKSDFPVQPSTPCVIIAPKEDK